MTKVNLYELKENEKREAYFIGFIGTNRTGKTTLMKQVINEYREKYPNNEIIAYDPQRKLSDIVNDTITEENELFEVLERRDVLLILDDYDSLIKGNQVTGAFKSLCQLRAEYGIDIFFATHHPQLIKQGMTYYITHLYMFYCNLSKNIVGIDKKVPNGELIEFLFRDVAKEAKLKGKGTFEKQNFKHVIFSNLEGTFKRVNFESKITERCNIN